jgi:hypothetical protein
MSFKLDYPITRPFGFPYFTFVVLLLAGIWLTFITVVNVVAVAYDTVPFTSPDFNETTKLWYETFIPTFWLPPSRSCEASVIPVTAGYPES